MVVKMANKYKQTMQKLLAHADVKIDGTRPWDIKVKNEKLYKRVLGQGNLGLGEAYMDGWWECQQMDELFNKILRAKLEDKIKTLKNLALVLKAKAINMQSISRAHIVGEKHYDAGNDLYEKMLDKTMTYSCGYWKKAKTLDQAQEAKLDLICKKLGLKKGQKILDIGCGWGSFAKYAAKKYKVKVVGITISKEQVKLAKKVCKELPVEIRLQDYRSLNEKFDHIVSIGMFEHVGPRNYKTFMKIVSRNLKPDGLFLLHTIGKNKSGNFPDPWMHKYIFPNGVLPSPRQITTAAEGLFLLEDWHNFGADYDKTAMQWYKNFTKNWNKIKDSYDERFYRMWTYYLLSCAGSFRAGRNQLWQIVFSKRSVPGGYKSIR